MKVQNLNDKFSRLYTIIGQESFVNMQSVGGEIPFYISTFQPEQTYEVEKLVQALKNRLDNEGKTVCEINLYDVCLDLLHAQGNLEKILVMETLHNKQRIKVSLTNLLDIEKTLTPAIADRVNKSSCKLVFITGIGYVYPYIRTHTVLNNIQSIIKKVPTIIFFPGSYDGKTLNLFGKLKDDHYYRAFMLDNVKL